MEDPRAALNLRALYGSPDLDAVHIFAMKAALRVAREGMHLLEAPAGTLSDAAADGYLGLAVRLVADSRVPEIIDRVLDAEYAALARREMTAKQLLVLDAVRKVIPAVVQRRELAALVRFEDIWGMAVNEFSQKEFYPTLTKEELGQVGWDDSLPSVGRFIPTGAEE